jgi:c-di-GMP-binding flagellar brake protein YcgR
MPKCPLCKRDLPDIARFEMTRTPAGLRLLACPQCAGTTGPRSRPAGQESGRRTSSLRLAASQRETLEALREIYQEVRDQPEEAPRETPHKRTSERHEVDLELSFSFLRDQRAFEGQVRDISQGGLRFITDQEVKVGHVLRVTVRSSARPDEAAGQPSFAEVRRVVKNEDGRFEVGARFVRRIGVDDTNRRRHPRRAMTAPVFYRCNQSDLILRGTAMDISQGGLRLGVSERPTKGAALALYLRTEPPAFVYADIEATAEIVRVAERAPGRYELGCAFRQLNVTPVQEADPEPPAAEAEA